jgi:hypothetical protein
MTLSTDRSFRSRYTGDDGAVIAEFALALPFIMMVVLGLLEYGFLFRQTNLLAGVAQAGARAGASGRDARDADKNLLATIYAQLPALKRATVSKVIVYKASAADGSLPPGCLPSGGQPAKCNVFSNADVTDAYNGTGQFASPLAPCTGNSGPMKDHFWCPTERVASMPGPPDWIGVYVELDYTTFTRFFPTLPRKIHDQAVFREEVFL